MAMAVAGIFLSAMVLTFQKLLFATMVTRQRTVAGNLCQERLERLKNYAYHRLIPTTAVALLNSSDSTNPYPPEFLPAQGVTFTRYTVIQKANVNGTALTLLAPDANDPGLKSIAVTVSWVESNQTKSVVFTSLLEDPNRAPLDSQIHGAVTDPSSSAVPGVLVYVLSNPNWSFLTDSAGRFTLQVANGTYQVTANNDAYLSQSSGSLVLASTTLVNNFTSYTLKQTGMVSGYVFTRPNLVISELCPKISTDSDHEYFELYNPTSSTLVVSSATVRLSLVNQNNVVTTMVPAYTNTLVEPNKYFLFANAPQIVALGVTVTADAVYATTSLDDIQGGVVLADASGNLIDKVGYGSPGNFKPAPSNAVETTGIDINPTLMDNCIERRSYPSILTLMPNSYGNAADTQNNSNDFMKHATLNPQNSSSAAETPNGGTVLTLAMVFTDDGLSSTVTTSSLGVYSDTNVASGTWTVTASGGSSMTSLTYSVASLSLVMTNNASLTRDLVLTGGTAFGYITGQVTTGGTTALNNILMRAGTSQTRTNSNGNYNLALMAGTYNPIANYNYDNLNYSQNTYNTTLTLVAGNAYQADFNLSGAGIVSGKVTINGTDALPNIEVSALNALNQVAGRAVTNSSGNYTISGLPTSGNNYTVSPLLDPRETSAPSTRTVTVASGSTTGSLNFTISNALGTLSGQVKLSTGELITTGVVVVATTGTITGDPPTINSTVRGGSTVYYAATSDSEGTYSVQLRGAASPGTTYNVYAWYTNSSGTTTKKSGTKAIIAGGSATLDFTTF